MPHLLYTSILEQGNIIASMNRFELWFELNRVQGQGADCCVKYRSQLTSIFPVFSILLLHFLQTCLAVKEPNVLRLFLFLPKQ